MKAAILLKPGHLAVQEVREPEPGPGEVLVRVRAALTCGTDLKAFLRGHPQIPMPGPFGHEFSGDVVAVGTDVTRFAPGDPVMAVHSAPCGDCYWCRREQGNLCEHIMATKVLGAYAEHVLLPAHIVRQNAYRKPNSLSYAEAALLEPLACVAHGLAQIHIRSDDTVLILGSGSIGLLFLLALRGLGVDRVLVSGRRAARLQLANRLGASAVHDAGQGAPTRFVQEATAGRGADVVIECTGQPAVWEAAPHYVRRGGEVLLFGGLPQGQAVRFDSSRLHYDQITLRSPFHFGPEAVAQAYRWLAEGRVKGGPLITGEIPLERLPQAFVQLQQGEHVKLAVTP